jgi:carbamoylphosphate synthase small subunit
MLVLFWWRQEWLTKEKVPGLYGGRTSTAPHPLWLLRLRDSVSWGLILHGVEAGVDTRLLTKKIRDAGALRARIEFEPDFISAVAAASSSDVFHDPNMRHLVAEVSTSEVKIYGASNSGPKILAVDCGIKNNMIRHFLARNCQVKIVPWDYDFTQDVYDGLFISNGPGDPTMCSATIEHLRTILEGRGGVSSDKPLFGICLVSPLTLWAVNMAGRAYRDCQTRPTTRSALIV